ncbi:MAG: mechanosensitive ion channel family protein [Bdellovibrionales bacterium]|nr:mechanosensitive ion channel family protein [Bdellovibrionales bacterium]
MDVELEKSLNLFEQMFSKWYDKTIDVLPSVFLAIVVFILFLYIAKLSKSIAKKTIPRFSDNVSVNNLMVGIIYLVTLAVGTFVTLGILNLDKTVTSLLAGAGVIGIAIGFAFQEIASNFIAGIFIAFRKPYKVGDMIKVDNYFGEVTNIDLRATSITELDDVEVLIPNKDMFTKPFTNYTLTTTRRIQIDVGISYAEDLRKVEHVVKEALEDVIGRAMHKPIEFYYQGFGDSSINFTVFIWIIYPGENHYYRCQHDAIIRIKEAFDQNGITIPFPIRTLDFGIKGGMNLKQPLQETFTNH